MNVTVGLLPMNIRARLLPKDIAWLLLPWAWRIMKSRKPARKMKGRNCRAGHAVNPVGWSLVLDSHLVHLCLRNRVVLQGSDDVGVSAESGANLTGRVNTVDGDQVALDRDPIDFAVAH